MSARGRLAAIATTVLIASGVVVGGAAAQSTTTTAPGATPATPEITAAQAGPGILLTAEDRVELASTLAEATTESGTCFGYRVNLGGSGAADRTETLSNAGPDREPRAADCPKGSVLLQVSITYTSESSESDDSASFLVSTDVPGLSGSVATKRMKDLSGVDDGDFTGDDDDLALRNATAALPLILDGATPAELAAPAAKAPNGDRLTGSPSSDWIRAHGLGIGIAFVVLLVALGLILGGLLGRRQSGKPKRPLRDSPSSTTTIT